MISLRMFRAASGKTVHIVDTDIEKTITPVVNKSQDTMSEVELVFRDAWGQNQHAPSTDLHAVPIMKKQKAW